jgi:2-aminoadipate transaminase
METIFADRISDVPKSFIREILKVTIDPEVISFAGGLPNRAFFPVEPIAESCARVLRDDGPTTLQYSTTEGHAPLRQFIADRYAAKGITISPDEIIITNGSQQALDLLAKTFVNESDPVIIERPGYLGAIQALSVYRARFLTVNLDDEGPDIAALRAALAQKPKLFYAVPNFQNPSGVTWNAARREAVAEAIAGKPLYFIEDDPYGELRFSGEPQVSMKVHAPENTVLLGSFSKIFAPSLRLGWIAAPREILDRITVAKQAADLHTNYFSQRILMDFLQHNDLEAHIERIRTAYGAQRNAMVKGLEEHMPAGTKWTNPEGGMFLWVTLPEGMNALSFFDRAIARKVAFVPGNPFYPSEPDVRTMRLNFSCSDDATIAEGIRRLAAAMKDA